MSNDNRSPLWDKKLTFIGILLAVVIAATFVLFNFNNERYSEVKAASKSAETTNQFTITNTSNPIQYIEYKGEEKARIAHQHVAFDEYEGVPDSVKAIIEKAKFETINCSSKTDSIPDKAVVEREQRVAKRAKEAHEDTIDKTTCKNATKTCVTVEAEVIEPEPEPEEEQEDPLSNMTYYGCLELTAYTWTGNPCADGVYPSSGYTVACNNSDLWHRWIYIEGYGIYFVHDTGGMGWGVIDVYMDSYDACIQFGRRSANIYVLN